MVIKKTQPTSKSSTKTTKPSAKKNIAGKETKTVKKAEIKKPVKAVKAPGTKLSRSKTAAKPAVKKASPEIKKIIKPIEVKRTTTGKITAKKPDKTSVATAKGKKAQPKKSLNKISLSKPEIKEKKSLKKSPAKIVGAKIPVTQQKTIKPASTKKPSVGKVGKAVTEKAKVKTAKKIKTPAKTESTIITEKKSAVKTGLQKKLAISGAIPQIKETVKQKTVLKSKEKTETPLSTVRKTVKKKETSSLITTEPLPVIGEKPTVAHTASPQVETKPKKASNLKVFLPEEELPPEEAPQVTFPQLPEEYGENELLVMEVDPSIVFVSWEIKPEDISGEAGKLALRVYDVTGIDFDGTNANRSFDISLRNRADSKFFDVKMQGREIIMEIGLVHPEGRFKALKRSNRVSMPALQTLEEFDIAGPLSDSDTLIGY